MMTFMTVLLNDILINIESDNRADCTQRFHLKEHSCRWLNLITSQWISQSVRFSSQLCRDLRTCEYMLRVLSAALQVFVLVFNTHLPFHLWCFITISSLNMSRKAAEPVYSLKMFNVEKSLDVQPPTADNMLSKVELKKPLLNNADSSEVAENKSKKKKKEGIKNYFISDESKYLCWIELIHQQWIFQYANRLNILLYIITLTDGLVVDAALPLMTLVFSSLTAFFNNFAADQNNTQQFTAQINYLVLYFVYLFVACFIISYMTTLYICITAIRTIHFLRKMFLKSLLRQKVWHFNKEDNKSSVTQVTMSTWSFIT